MPPHPEPRARYRPEIDGLRAVAVLAVLIYHAELTLGGEQVLRGGFFGVDVFFVISGFLITSILLAEFRGTGTLSFRRFYERRARRLLPALLLVMLASLPVAWALLTPTQLVDFSKSLWASLAFGSNFYWKDTLQEYGAESGLIKPFLHTWSLAVEEQYYFVTPLLLLVLYRWLFRHAVPLLSLLLLASFGLAEALNDRDGAFAFYMLPTRFWEIAVGALLAHFAGDGAGVASSAGWRRFGPALGLGLIVLPMGWVPFDDRHPGFVTLAPVIGTALILGCASGRELVTRILSARLPVGIGLISYSLYLWHYPIFAFGRLRAGEPGPAEKLVWLVLAFVLAGLSYRFVEGPLRSHTRCSTRTALGTILVATLVVIGVSGLFIQRGGAPGRFERLTIAYGENEFDNQRLQEQSWSPLNELAARYAAPGTRPADLSSFEQGKLRRESQQRPWFEDPEATRVLLVGDSHGKNLFNALVQNRELFPGHEFAFWRWNLGPSFGGNAARTRSKAARADDERSQELALLLQAPNYLAADRVVLANRYAIGKGESGRDAFTEMLAGVVVGIQSGGKPVTVVGNTVEFEQGSDGRTLFDQLVQAQDPGQLAGEGEELAVRIRRRYFESRTDPLAETGLSLERTNELVREVCARTGAQFLDLAPLLCDDARGECDGVTPDGFKAFFDYGHWTLEGARHFGRELQATGWPGGR